MKSPAKPSSRRQRRLLIGVLILSVLAISAITGVTYVNKSVTPDPARDLGGALSFYQSSQFQHLSPADQRRYDQKLIEQLRAKSFLTMLQMMGDRFRAQKDISRFIADPIFAAFVEKFYDMPWLQRQIYLTTFAIGSQAVFASHPDMTPKPGALQQSMATVMSADGPRQQGYIQQFFCDLGQKRAAMGLHGGPW